MILASLAGLLLFGFVILFVDDQRFFLARSRSWFRRTQSAGSLTRLSPDAMETEMFGLYAMTGKSAALGPIFVLWRRFLRHSKSGSRNNFGGLAAWRIVFVFRPRPAT